MKQLVHRTVLRYLLFFGFSSEFLPSQVLREQLPFPSRAGITLKNAVINAGESLELSITFESVVPEAMTLRGSLLPPGAIRFLANNPYAAAGMGLQFQGGIGLGEKTAKLQVPIPSGAPPGDYSLTSVTLSDGDVSKVVQVNTVSIQVVAAPPPVPHKPKPILTFPSRATVDLTLTQKQFILGQVAPIEDIRTRLLDRLASDAANTLSLDAALLKTMQDADSLLPATESSYSSGYPVSKELPIVLFEDLHRHYQAAIIDLKRKLLKVRLVQRSTRNPLLIDTAFQIHKRPNEERKGPESSSSLAGSFTLETQAVLELLEQNAQAYKRIAQSGSGNFSINLSSAPIGATISHKRLGVPYVELSKPTNVFEVTFPYAIWTFRFEKKGCRPQEHTPNVYIEEKPELSVELHCS